LLPFEQAAALVARLDDEVGRVIIGQRQVRREILTCLFAGGHCLLRGVPGLAKTLLIKTLADAVSLKFNRIQFTPDLMPSDILGTEVIEDDDAHGKRHVRFIPGPVFANIILADEINRTPPRTQAALLEAMQEGQVTHAGTTHRLPRPFCVLATHNPIELEGTYPLPEAQLDRFLIRLGVGYPDREQEWQLLERRIERAEDEVRLDRVVDRETLLAMQRAIEQVYVSESIGYYIVDLVAATRESGQVEVGASPRGSLALLKLARCRAALFGRDFVTPEDVKGVAVPALAHRLMLRPELWVRRVRPEDVVEQALDSVPTPAPEDART